MATIKVGPQQEFKTPLPACMNLRSGDTLEIEAGTYVNGLIGIRKGVNNVTIRGIGPPGAFAHLKAEPAPGSKMPPSFPARGAAALAFGGMGDKGICVIKGNDVTMENIKFSGARSYAFNGAGIRHEGINLTVKKCCFEENQNGILSSAHDDPATADVNEGGRIWIEESEFVRNGAGDGQSHNLYIGLANELIFYRNNSHASRVGHLYKGRAHTTLLLENRLHDEDGTGSYIADINGGRAYVIANDIEKGLNSSNKYSAIFYYVMQYPVYPPHSLLVRGNRMKCLLQVRNGAFVRAVDDVLTLTYEPLPNGKRRRAVKTPAGHAEMTGRIADNTLIYAPSFDRAGGETAYSYRPSAFVVPPGIVVEDTNYFFPLDQELMPEKSPERLTPDNFYAYLASLK